MKQNQGWLIVRAPFNKCPEFKEEQIVEHHVMLDPRELKTTSRPKGIILANKLIHIAMVFTKMRF